VTVSEMSWERVSLIISTPTKYEVENFSRSNFSPPVNVRSLPSRGTRASPLAWHPRPLSWVKKPPRLCQAHRRCSSPPPGLPPPAPRLPPPRGFPLPAPRFRATAGRVVVAGGAAAGRVALHSASSNPRPRSHGTFSIDAS
jgi:hypothetical protein